MGVHAHYVELALHIYRDGEGGGVCTLLLFVFCNDRGSSMMVDDVTCNWNFVRVAEFIWNVGMGRGVVVVYTEDVDGDEKGRNMGSPAFSEICLFGFVFGYDVWHWNYE